MRYLDNDMRGTFRLQVISLRGVLVGGSFREPHYDMRVELLVVVKHLFDSVEVEVVADVLFVDFTEKLVVFQVAKPAYPSHTLL